jgi:hypothetical protein
MKLTAFCNAFPTVIITGIDAATLRFNGPTDGYDDKNYSVVGIVAENAHEQVEEIKKTFHLSPEYSKPEDYIWVRDKFDDYEKDKRPRVAIKLKNGYRGMTNPPSFHLSE